MNNPYPLIFLAIIVLVLYFISHFAVRFKIFNLATHRKIWNVLLLLTFLVTAILGLLLVIQINYKFNWAFINSILKYHVDFGIAMSFVAVFHFLWHWGYYSKILRFGRFEKHNESVESQSIKAPEHLSDIIFISGFLSIVSQVLLIREITTVFQGNELYMAWTLSIWMLLTGIGTIIGLRKSSIVSSAIVYRIILFLSVMPLIILLTIDLFKNSVFLPGVLISPWQFLLTVSFLLAPICLLTGFLYSLLIDIQGTAQSGFSKVYSIEAAGSVIGGLNVSFALVRWFSNLQSMLVMVLFICLGLYYSNRKIGYLSVATVALIGILACYLLSIDIGLKSKLYVNQKVVETKETPYGNITVCENADELSFFDNGNLLYTSQNVVYNEEYAHYAMLQSQHPKKVLLVSGSVSGVPAEILKYRSVEQIDCVELNPELIRIAQKQRGFLKNQKITMIFEDGRRYIQHCTKSYDVIIFAVPDPTSFTYNRFYSLEFLSQVKKKLAINGVIAFGLSPAGDYLNLEKTKTEASVYSTLRKVFNNVLIIPGGKDFFIASDTTLNSGVASLAAKSGIETSYVNPNYIDDELIQQRQSFILKNIGNNGTVNTDQKPVPVFYHTFGFLARFNERGWILFLLPAVLLIFPLLFFRKAPSVMFSAGFTAASLEMLLIFTFQTFYGYVYSALGLIVAIFMAGISAGAIIGGGKKIEGKNALLLFQLALIVIPALFIGVWQLHQSVSNQFILMTVFLLYTLLIAIITGLIYVVCTQHGNFNVQHNAKLIYAADLAGSAIGAFLITVVLVPLVGIINSSLIISVMNGIFLGVQSMKK